MSQKDKADGADGKKSAKEQVQAWEKAANESQRDFSGPLETHKEQLRDAYMNFKDLQQRCTIDMQQ